MDNAIIGLILEHGNLKVVGDKLNMTYMQLKSRLYVRGYVGRGKKWQIMANHLGYGSEREMWIQLYCNKGLRPSDMKAMFWDVWPQTIRDRIRKCGLELRGRGGANHVKMDTSTI